MKVDLYNKKGKKTSKIDLNDKVFSVKPNDHTIYLAVKSELAANRQGTSSSKTRAEVRGGGTKPWKQKGTGRARAGSTRNPSRVHGGTAFGPTPRDYRDRINKKVKHLARKSVLSDKLSNKNLIGIDIMDLKKPKTKDIVKILDNLKISEKKLTILLGDYNENIWLSIRNLKNVTVIDAMGASAYDLLDCETLLIDKAGIKLLNKSLA